jgi:hypothetical protein
MKKALLIIVAVMAVTRVHGSGMLDLPYPIQWQTEVSQVTRPVIVRNANGRWMSTVMYDVRNQTVYDAVGTRNELSRLVGSMTIEISANEVFALTGQSPTNKYGPGEWEDYVYQAGLTKAVILSQPSEQRTQYETYWTQVEYAPEPVSALTEDADGNPVLAVTENNELVIGYTDDEEETPVLGTWPVDAGGNTIIGYWRGFPVTGYDPLGFPLIAQME